MKNQLFLLQVNNMSIKTCVFFTIILFSFNNSFAQTYEVRRVDDGYREPIDYGHAISTLDIAEKTGEVQTKLQARYDSNFEKVNTKINNIGKIIRKLRIKHEDGTRPFTDNQRKYLNEYGKNLEKIQNINLTSNSQVQSVLSYLNEIESELYDWL
jgi:hypothetical protein